MHCTADTLRLLLWRLLLLGGAVAGEWSVAAGQAAEMYPCNVGRIIDGDTILVTALRLDWSVGLFDRQFRLLSLDAFESRRIRQSVGEITDAELAKGKEAKSALEGLLKDGECYIAPGDVEQDNYGRLLGRLYVRKGKQLIDVATYMREHDFDRDVTPEGKPRK